MQLTKTFATIIALCVVTGMVIYGGIFLRPELAGSTPLVGTNGFTPKYLYTIGDASGPKRPNAVAVLKGKVYVTDAAEGKVFIYSEKGRKLGEFGKTGEKKQDLAFPNGVLATSEGNLLVSDSVNNDIKLFSPKGEYIKTLQPAPNAKPGYMIKGSDGMIYVSDLAEHRILVINEKGKLLRVINDKENPLSYPQGIAVDPKGRLWVADGGNYLIKIFEPKGKMASEIRGGGAPETFLSMVRGITFDQEGRAYVSDTIAHQIRIFDLNGRQESVFSTEDGTEAELMYPTSILAGPGEKLYVVDRGAGNVKVFSLSE